MSTRRTYFDRDPDPVRLFDELYFRGERDFRGLPLGNVVNHVRNRYCACYGALCLAQMLTDLGRIEAPASMEVKGAAFQDKQTSREFPAAHAIPCDLILTMQHPTPRQVHLYDLLHNVMNKVWVQRNIFGQTDRVHRLVNIADSSCERGPDGGPDGMTAVFARACREAIEDSLRAKTLGPPGSRAVLTSRPARFETTLVPGFVKIARHRLNTLKESLTQYEREELRRGQLLNQFGAPALPRPADTRLGSPDDEARAAARIALCQILELYADPALLDRSALVAVAGKIDALRHNERGH